jgi:hypothetical protein
MAEKFGGGAEKYARFKQYDYRAVSCGGGSSSSAAAWSQSVCGAHLEVVVLSVGEQRAAGNGATPAA